MAEFRLECGAWNLEFNRYHPRPPPPPNPPPLNPPLNPLPPRQALEPEEERGAAVMLALATRESRLRLFQR